MACGNMGKKLPDEIKRRALALYAKGLTRDQIAKRCGCSPSAVSNWIRDHKAKESGK